MYVVAKKLEKRNIKKHQFQICPMAYVTYRVTKLKNIQDLKDV